MCAVTIRRKPRKKPGWYFVVIILLVIGCYGFFRTGKGLIKFWRLSRLKRIEEKALKKDLERKEALKKEIGRLKSDSTYIEEIARGEYGMKKEVEEVFQITLPDSSEKGKK
ncbi:MAG: hypothetical protein HOC71_06240 [Candidatus Latescibacteria bacterium]|jgi:cell division protein FtsB|nr:hypothetical protein [Candidatus Latescibacterota bacterium]